MILRIDHTAISVPNLDEALAFYCGVLGFEIEYRLDWPKGTTMVDDVVGLRDSAGDLAMIKLDGTRIELFQYANPVAKPQEPNRPVCDHGFTHICLAVAGIDHEYERLSAAGVRFHSPPRDLISGIFAYGRDPFGNVLELKECA